MFQAGLKAPDSLSRQKLNFQRLKWPHLPDAAVWVTELCASNRRCFEYL